jgi:hypothetical protein
VLSLSSLIEFLLDMLRDDTTQNDFARDPHATLAARGLSGITAQDIQDVTPLLGDHAGVTRTASSGTHHSAGHNSGGQHSDGGYGAGRPVFHGHDDPVRAIQQVTNEYHVDRSTEVHNSSTTEYKSFTTITNNVDQSIHQGDNGVVIQDSFNQDNDGVDNKGGTIDHGVVSGHDTVGSANRTEATNYVDSFNDDHSSTDIDADDHATVVYDDWAHAGGGHDAPAAPAAGGHEAGSSVHASSFSGPTVNDSYAADPSAAAAASHDGAELATTHH